MKSFTPKPLASFIAAAITTGGLAHLPAHAESEEDSVLETITVYAQKRAQALDDVSVAVTAVDGERIRELNFRDTSQLAQLAPNLIISNNAGEGSPPAFFIRGVGLLDFNTSSISPVAVYSDGVVSGSANNLVSNLFDVEQVEVLRGPQGTLFGRNTTGGAILVRSRMPEAELGGYITAGAAQNDHTFAEGALNLPLGESTALRVAFDYDDYEFSINNLFPGAPNGGQEQLNLRAILTSEWDDVSLVFKVHHEDWDGDSKPVEPLGVFRQGGGGALCAPEEVGDPDCVDAFGFRVDSDNFFDTFSDTRDHPIVTDSQGASLQLEWRLSDTLTLTSITGVRELERLHSFDSYGPANFIEGDSITDNELFSQEINLAYSTDEVYWITGLFYINEEIIQRNNLDLFRDFRAIPELADAPAQFFYNNDIENTSVALYSQVDWTIDDTFTLTAGIRYTDDQTDYVAIGDLDTAAFFLPGLWNVEGEVDDGEFSGKLALIQQLQPNWSMYYSYSRGYKSGGYNGGFAVSPEQAATSDYGPEQLDAYEIGSKMSLWQGSADWNVAAFYYQYKDQQVFVNLTTGSVPFMVLKNGDDSTIYGLESEFTYQPTDQWLLNFNLGYIPRAEIGSLDDGEILVEEARLPFTSRWNLSGFAQYNSQLFDLPLRAELGFDYRSDFSFNQNENPYTRQSAFALWNGRVSMEMTDQFSVGLWGKNLFDKEYAELRFDSISTLGAIVELKADGRQLGMDVTYTF